MKTPTDPALRQYRGSGYYAPVPVLSSAEATRLRKQLESFETTAGILAGKLRHKSHLLFTWLNDLIRTPAYLT